MQCLETFACLLNCIWVCTKFSFVNLNIFCLFQSVSQKNQLSAEIKRDDLLPLDQLTKSLLRVKLPNSQVSSMDLLIL